LVVLNSLSAPINPQRLLSFLNDLAKASQTYENPVRSYREAATRRVFNVNANEGSNNPGTARKFNFTGYTKKTINLK
jgi:hypothetical protein